MNYELFLDLATELGYRLSSCGAETYRVEESINRVLAAYNIQAEAYAIPNCLTVTLLTADGVPLTRIRRIDKVSSDLDAVERYSGLSRRICAETPDPKTAITWLQETNHSRIYYTPFWVYVGYFLGSAGFGWFYGGSLADGLCAGVCGLAGCATERFMNRVQVNKFFSTIITAFSMAMTAYLLHYLSLCANPDAAIIGTLMTLVPGLLFTNAMRDIIFGDTNSGVARIVQVLLIAVSIALGTGSALGIYRSLFGIPLSAAPIPHSYLIVSLACAVGCAGFTIYYNIHGPGMLICVLGGVLTWSVYYFGITFGASEYIAYFIASAVASLFAEIMARIRKYPAISYLVVSVFPLLPGGGIYYTMSHAVHGDIAQFSQKGMQTVSIAGAMAVGILMISTLFRLIATWRYARMKKLKNR